MQHWRKDTHGVTIIPKSKEERQHRPKDINGVIIIPKSKDRQDNGQKIPLGNHNPQIKQGKTTQWPKDTHGVIIILNQRRTDNTMAKDTSGIIIIPKSKKEREHNDQ